MSAVSAFYMRSNTPMKLTVAFGVRSLPAR